MKVLVVGGGGREHALAWKLSQSSRVEKLFVAPGNGGITSNAVAIPVSNIIGLADFAERENIDLTVVGPEEPLSLGLVDEFHKRGLLIFGPTKAAARLEWSKGFAKEIMLASGVKTARGAVFSNFDQAVAYVQAERTPPVVKADGLAAGKGVVVPDSMDEALETLREFLVEGKLGDAGRRVVLEERLTGREASVMALISGEIILPMVISSDHKRIFDGDHGPNTGGMGAISPTPVLSEAQLPELIKSVFRPVISELKKRKIDYCGFLYAGVMVLPNGEVSVIEFNCRLGDPETQAVLPRLESDLAEVLHLGASGKLAGYELKWNSRSSAVVVVASEGYPGKVNDGKEIKGLFPEESDLIVFQAGTKSEGGKIFSKGGRVLGVTGLGKDLPGALNKAYEGVSRVSFEGMQYRKDIGQNR